MIFFFVTFNAAFRYSVVDFFSACAGHSTISIPYDLTKIKTVSISYHSLIIILIILACLALFTLIYINRNRPKGNKADEIFREIALAHNKDKIRTLLKRHSSETLSGTINFIIATYAGVIEGFIHKDFRSLQKINSALDRQAGKQKRIWKRELLTLKRIDKSTTLEKSTWLHLANSCAEQLILCLKRITEPCIEHIRNDAGVLPEETIAEIMTTGHLLQSLMLRIKNVIQSSDYDEYEALFFTSSHTSEEFSRLQRQLISHTANYIGKNRETFHFYLHTLQESEELVCILRLLLRASRKFQSDQRF
jgi:hypothetical protein